MNQNKIKKETQFLIDSINFSIKIEGYNRAKIPILDANVNQNWAQLTNLASKHGIVPLYGNYTRQNFPESTFSHNINLALRTISLTNLATSVDFVQMNKLLIENNINFINYKGHLFLNKYYSSIQSREVGDLDIIVAPQDVKKALKLLLNFGYKFDGLNNNSDYLIEIIPSIFGMNEITLVKYKKNDSIYIDFHWGFHYSFLPYKINLELFFQNTTFFIVNGQKCITPSEESNFIMLLIHHGGRDVWYKLKYLADLMAFMETSGEQIDWQKMIAIVSKMQLKRPMLMGFFLLKTYFNYPIPKVIEDEFNTENITYNLTLPIVEYWENCYNILTLKGRLKYERILISIQDKGFSKRKYVKEIVKMYSRPNTIESKRLITFPEKYYLLNASSKIITYLYKRGFGRIIR